MREDRADIAGQYGRHDLMQRVRSALDELGAGEGALNYRLLQRFDQLHGGGIEATRRHAQLAGIEPGASVLDIGCGIGGSARFLAAECGARVTGIDLTPEFVEVASYLTQRTGLGDEVAFRVADATDLPFEAASFDHVFCHNVTMNIRDKDALARSVARVLGPGGVFSCFEVARGAGGELSFPLPWASTPAVSFVTAPDVLPDALRKVGMTIVRQEDATQMALAFQREAAERRKRGEAPATFNAVVMGEDFSSRGRNYALALSAGALLDQAILARL